MKGVVLAFLLCCAAVAVVNSQDPDIRRISILEILQKNPSLREELSAKIKSKTDSPSTTAAPATTKATPASTTTTPAPQADSPPEVTTETTTPAAAAAEEKTRARPARRRRPVVAESEKFSDAEPGHRLRVVPKGNGESERQNGRRFPGAS